MNWLRALAPEAVSAPRRERLGHHFRHAGSYIDLAARNLALAVPVLRRYRRYMKSMHSRPVEIDTVERAVRRLEIEEMALAKESKRSRSVISQTAKVSRVRATMAQAYSSARPNGPPPANSRG